MMPNSILLLLVALLACVAHQHAALAQSSKNTHAKYCRGILGKLAEHHQIAELRDMIQLWGMYSRIAWESDSVVYNNQRSTADLTEDEKKELEHAWKADEKTVAQAAVQRDTYRQLETEQKQKIDMLMANLKDTGVIPQNVTLELLTPCIVHRLNTHLYADTPVVSFMLQYFKHPKTIEPIISTLIKCNAIARSELLVNVDNKDEAAVWAQAVEDTDGFVVPVFSANVHEARGYNRLARMAAGKLLVFLQDDFVLTDNCTWLSEVMSIYERWPEIGAVGLKGYVWGWPPTSHGPPWFKDPVTGVNFQFVSKVDWAPMSARKSAFLQIGGIDESIADKGSCGIASDFDVCMRMWHAGWKVAYYTVPYNNIDYGGTHSGKAEARCWHRQQGIAAAVIVKRAHRDLEILASVQAMNDNFQLLQPINATRAEELRKYCTPWTEQKQ